jgi:hypothetical protein
LTEKYERNRVVLVASRATYYGNSNVGFLSFLSFTLIVRDLSHALCRILSYTIGLAGPVAWDYVIQHHGYGASGVSWHFQGTPDTSDALAVVKEQPCYIKP